MPFTASAQSLKDWLRTVKAGRPPNVQVTGLDVADQLVATAQVVELGHLATPDRLIRFGANRTEVGGAQPEHFEIRAVRPFYLEVVRTLAAAGAVMSQIDAHVLGTADQVPMTYGGPEAATCRFRVGKVAGLPGEGFIFPTTDYTLRFERGLYVPEGKVLAFVTLGAGGGLLVSFVAREVPNPKTAP